MSISLLRGRGPVLGVRPAFKVALRVLNFHILEMTASASSISSAEVIANFSMPRHGDIASRTMQTGKDAGLDFSYKCALTNALWVRRLTVPIRRGALGLPVMA
jgi:hypothetical protein